MRPLMSRIAPLAIACAAIALAALGLTGCAAAVVPPSASPSPAAASTAPAVSSTAPPAIASPAASGGPSGGGGYTQVGGGHCGALAVKRVEGAAKTKGRAQELTIDTAAGYFQPNEISATAGLPLRIVFTGTSACIRGIAFPGLGIERALTGEPVAVTLPALPVGVYTLRCSHNAAFATIFAKAGSRRP